MDKGKLVRFLNGASSKAEEKEVVKWLNQDEADGELEQLFEKAWKLSKRTTETEQKKGELLESINQKIGDKKSDFPVRNQFIPQLKVAAIWLVLIGFLALTVKVILDNKPIEKEQVLAIEWIERIVPPGRKLHLVLPDKSMVLLNSNSTIRFPSAFDQKSRQVYLEGEAFFEVKKDKERPFKVHAGEMTTEVLGTSFNVVSRLQDNRVALVEGEVKITSANEDLLLAPGEKVEYNYTSKNHLQVLPFIYESEIGWKEGQIKFQKKSLKNILEQLEQWYGVTFIPEIELDLSRTVTGTFENDNLDNLLIGLGFTLNFKHSIEKKNVKLKSL